MKSYGLIQDVPKDLFKVFSSLSEISTVYYDKISKYVKRRLIGRENAKLKLHQKKI